MAATLDTDGAIPQHTDGVPIAIPCTTAAGTAAEAGTGAEATMEEAGDGTELSRRVEISASCQTMHP